MPEDAPPNSGAPGPEAEGPWARVSEMQAKLHRWAVADPGRRFDDLFNFVHDPATLHEACWRVAGNRGANTPGVDGMTVALVEERIGVPEFLDGLRAQLKQGTFAPLPVRERLIPKPGGSGKLRKLGIPGVADKVVQAALKLVLEPIFETDFLPCSYGFRPKRRAHDAIAEIHHFGTLGYRWVLDADVEAAFDNLSHSFVMDRVRARVKDKRVLALVKAFLKAGVLTELGEHRETLTGTPQGGILSPLIFNIALTALDEHVMAPWKPGGPMSTPGKRFYRRSKGQPTWRIVRYADDFVILVHGSREDTQALREDVARVLAPMGLRLSPAKTQVVHMGDGFCFLGFRIRWKRKRGTNKWYVYTFIADRPVNSLRAKIRALTHRTSQWGLASVLTRLGQIMRGWAMYFRYAVAKNTFGKLDSFTFWRIAHVLRARHGWNWGQLRRHLTTPDGKWRIAADGVEFFRIEKVTVSRYTYRGNKIPSPGRPRTTPDDRNRGEPVTERSVRRVRRAARGNGPGATPAPRPGPTQQAARM